MENNIKGISIEELKEYETEINELFQIEKSETENLTENETESFNCNDSTDKEINQEEIIPWPDEIDEKAYHGLAGEVVKAFEPYTEADNVAILMSFLTTFGNYIGKDVFTKVSADTHSTNLFTLLIGDTAKARKGTSWGPIRELFSRLDEFYMQEKCIGGLSSGEFLVKSIRDPKFSQEFDEEKGYFVDKVVDAGVSDKRLLVIESEFASVLNKMQKEGNTLSTMIRQAWDGYKLENSSISNPYKATKPHISIIGHITIEELKKYLDNTELFNGFANRFLWMCIRRSKLLPDAPEIPNSVYNELLLKLKDVLNWIKTLKSEDRHIKRNSEANEMWHNLYYVLTEPKDGIIGAITSRAETQVLRLSLLYAILDKSQFIKPEHIEAGLAIWNRCQQSVEFIFNETGNDPIAENILEGLKKYGPMTQTEIYKNIFLCNVESSKIKNTLQKLSARQKVIYKTIPTKGRPKMMWELNK
jgi:hypothetical protein